MKTRKKVDMTFEAWKDLFYIFVGGISFIALASLHVEIALVILAVSAIIAFVVYWLFV